MIAAEPAEMYTRLHHPRPYYSTLQKAKEEEDKTSFKILCLHWHLISVSCVVQVKQVGFCLSEGSGEGDVR